MSTDRSSETARPLTGIRVVSLAEQFPGPYATLLLGDLGADVIQVERPQGGDPSRAFAGFYQALNRGKRSVTLDLKHPNDLAACRRLVDTADILLEGFRPGVLDRLGLAPASLLADRPELVVVSISGFGQDGPYVDRPAHDLSFQALAGLLDGGSASAPGVPMLSLADLTSGLVAALAATSGLAARTQTGRGGHWDVSMFDSLVSLVTPQLFLAANGLPGDSLGSDPGYGVFRAADDRWVTLSIAFEDHFWAPLCVALGLPELAKVPGPERVQRRDELVTAVADALATQPAHHWDTTLGAAGVPFGTATDVGGLLVDPQVRARELLPRLSDGRHYVRAPLVVDGRRLGPRRGTPALGEHTDEVLAELDERR
jgi:crotonobetainyl-CoA:carnitine CoA-transferase CaiB-like acyl-CoA transferase